jgi:predicted dinucleotide-binding enzyme
MRHAVLGTGNVGRTIGRKLLELGHEVRLGSRTADNAAAAAWVAEGGARASQGTFADAAAFGEIVWNCTSGAHTLAVAAAAGEGLSGKVLLDLANPLNFSQGFPPFLDVANTESLAERLQAAHPEARVVKTLNTMGAAVMVDPSRVPGAHDVFVCGDEAAAKELVVGVLGELGWSAPIDLGPLSAARGTEAWLLLWTRLYGALGTSDFNLRIVRGGTA